jgi:3-hydroxyisobutyrate dehydrogenase
MKAAVIGLGAMGTPMARNLHDAGYLAGVWNRTREKAEALAAETGVGRFDSVAELASQADLLLISVSDDAALREVVDAAAPHLLPGAVVVDTSTVSVSLSREISRELARFGVQFLDAPVSGGVEGARQASLVMMVGGPEAELERVRPALQALARRIEYLGPAGSGQAAKAVNQLMAAGINQAVSEALAFGEALDLPMDRLVDLLGEGAAGSWFLRHRGRSMLQEEFAPGFRMALHEKDLRLCRDLGSALGVHLPMVEMTLVHYRLLREAGHGDDDMSALIRQKRALFEKDTPGN